MATQTAGNAFRLIRDSWLALTYIGAILLLVSRPAWQRPLSVFSITGRMALTNYMLQVVILDLTFSNYAFGAQISAWLSPVRRARVVRRGTRVQPMVVVALRLRAIGMVVA